MFEFEYDYHLEEFDWQPVGYYDDTDIMEMNYNENKDN